MDTGEVARVVWSVVLEGREERKGEGGGEEGEGREVGRGRGGERREGSELVSPK